MPIRPATPADLSELLPLINGAYRGETSTKGWTHEAHLIAGDARTDEAELRALIQQPDGAILLYFGESGRMEGCVYLRVQERGIYLGMLTVNPERQGAGIGKLLLAAAEDFARTHGSDRIFMTVLSVRSELLAWYQRHGYRLTGESKPFEVPAKFGVPTQPLELVILEKPVPSQ